MFPMETGSLATGRPRVAMSSPGGFTQAQRSVRSCYLDKQVRFLDPCAPVEGRQHLVFKTQQTFDIHFVSKVPSTALMLCAQSSECSFPQRNISLLKWCRIIQCLLRWNRSLSGNLSSRIQEYKNGNDDDDGSATQIGHCLLNLWGNTNKAKKVLLKVKQTLIGNDLGVPDGLLPRSASLWDIGIYSTWRMHKSCSDVG